MIGLGASIRRWPSSIVAIAAVVVFGFGGATACGGPDYSEDNAALAKPLLANDQVITALGSEDTAYCASDSCTLGSDGMITTYVVSISAEFDQLVAAFRAAYPGFTIGSEICVESTCVDKYIVWATRADDAVDLAYDDNMTGRLTVDAHISDSPSTVASTAP